MANHSVGQHGEVVTLFNGLLPMSRDSGFRMEDYYVWGGSVIRVGSTYHMFASRWPAETGFPNGYRSHSEIVRAESSSPTGPYAFREVVISGRDGDYWDGKMAHNPTVHRAGDEFVLFYIGSPRGSGLRKVGYATAPCVTGPWTRVDKELPLSEDANNPAPCFEADGSVKLAFRDQTLRMGIACAPHYSGPYEVRDFDIMPGTKLEDPYLYHQDGQYHIVCEDNRAQVTGHERWGVRLVSEDGIHDWHPADPVIAYTHTIVWEDGSQSVMERRERPQMLFDEDGEVSHLCTGVLLEGKTWGVVQAVREFGAGD